MIGMLVKAFEAVKGLIAILGMILVFAIISGLASGLQSMIDWIIEKLLPLALTLGISVLLVLLVVVLPTAAFTRLSGIARKLAWPVVVLLTVCCYIFFHLLTVAAFGTKTANWLALTIIGPVFTGFLSAIWFGRWWALGLFTAFLIGASMAYWIVGLNSGSSSSEHYISRKIRVLMAGAGLVTAVSLSLLIFFAVQDEVSLPNNDTTTLTTARSTGDALSTLVRKGIPQVQELLLKVRTDLFSKESSEWLTNAERVYEGRYRLGRLDESLKLARETQLASSRRFGRTALDTSRHNVAVISLLIELGQYNDAKGFLSTTYAAYKNKEQISCPTKLQEGRLLLATGDASGAFDSIRIAAEGSQCAPLFGEETELPVLADMVRYFLAEGRDRDAFNAAVDLKTRMRIGGRASPAVALLVSSALYANEFYAPAAIEAGSAFATYSKALGSSHPVTLEALLQTTMAMREMGEIDVARTTLSKVAMQLMDQLGVDHPLTAQAVLEYVVALRKAAIFDEAKEFLNELTKVAEQSKVLPARFAFRVDEQLALLHLAMGDWTSAIALANESRYKLGNHRVGEAKWMTRQRGDFLRLLAIAHAKAGRPDEGLNYLEAAKRLDTADIGMAIVANRGDGKEYLRSQVADVERQIAYAVNHPILKVVLEQKRDKLLASIPDDVLPLPDATEQETNLSVPQIATQLQHRLPPSEAVLSYVLHPDGLGGVFYLSRSHLTFYAIRITPTLMKTLNRIQLQIAQPPGKNREGDTLIADLASLGNQLVPEPLRKIREERLLVSPDGPLRTLPLDALRVEEKYLAERYAISQSPRLDLLGANQVRRDGFRGKALLVGAGQYRLAASKRTDSTVLAALATNDPASRIREFAIGGNATLPDLPGVDSELEAISRVLGPERTTLMKDQQATLSQVKAQLANAKAMSEYSIAVFAVHGRSDPRDPALGALFFPADAGRAGVVEWSVTEIAALRLPFDVVFLSACDTAGGMGMAGRGEGLIGLPYAFIKAGSNAVVATLWKIDDSKAPEFSEAFFSSLRSRKNSYAESLAFAKRRFIQTTTSSDPFYWAGYVLYAIR